jgi:3-oxoacyl-[acyl-carrier-protein] synthase II
MTLITSHLREQLRERLMMLSLTHDVISEETLGEQIDRLLEDILSEQALTATLTLPIDEIDEESRIVITGMGALTPFGIGLETFWEGLATGQSGIRPFTLCDASDFPCQIGGEVVGFDPQEFIETKEARRMSRSSQLAVSAARLAFEDAGLDIAREDPTEIGTLIACGTSSFPDSEKAVRAMIEKGPMKVSPFYVPSALPNMPSSQVAIQLGLRGYSTTISTACAAGSQAIGEAAHIIRRGDASVMLAGGTEAPISHFSLASFCAMRALTSRNDEPERASRPFDVHRDGFAPAEGAGVLVLERMANARRRGARMYAELVGYGSSCDAYHVTAPDPEGEGAARAINRALFNAGLSPQQIDYINAHATSTIAGDVAETRSIKRVFGEYAYSVPISSTKSMIGHLTGAAGAVEAVATVLTLLHGIIPPTINLEEPDPECDLDYVPNVARLQPDTQIVMSNSFGFGGVNSVLIFRQINPDLEEY